MVGVFRCEHRSGADETVLLPGQSTGSPLPTAAEQESDDQEKEQAGVPGIGVRRSMQEESINDCHASRGFQPE